ncbi:MAG TPA: lipocalin family protein [Melioribacteraceae bacterium]|mgnify:CR=1 FL=1|nr:lipocalin family protein [Melioribacteraceae bacterium]
MKTNITLFSLSFLSIILLFGCSAANYPPLDVVKKVDIDRYLGKWYEIARLPFSQQEGCSCTTAEYELIDSTTIRVINKCIKEGELDDATGKAFVVEGSNNAKLRVQFFWPFRGDYWVIELDEENYQYAIVGTPSRKYLWILSRTPRMDEEIYNSLIKKAGDKGFDISKLIRTVQDCSN